MFPWGLTRYQNWIHKNWKSFTRNAYAGNHWIQLYRWYVRADCTRRSRAWIQSVTETLNRACGSGFLFCFKLYNTYVCDRCLSIVPKQYCSDVYGQKNNSSTYVRTVYRAGNRRRSRDRRTFSERTLNPLPLPKNKKIRCSKR